MKKFTKAAIAGLMVLVLLLSMTSCGEVSKAKKAVSGTLKAFKAFDLDAINRYMNNEEYGLSADLFGEEAEMEETLGKMFTKLDYKILSAEQADDTTVYVTTEITAVDMKPVMQEYMTKAMEYALSVMISNPQPTEAEIQQKMMEILSECLSAEELAMVTTEVEIKVVCENDTWAIVPDDAFVDAVTGNMMAAIDEAASAFGN